MKHILIAATLLSCGLPSGALAQESDSDETSRERIVVTGTRLVSRFTNDRLPVVTLVVRADEVTVETIFECDTRDDALRQSELRATLRNVVSAAQSTDGIDVGIFVAANDWSKDRIIPISSRWADVAALGRDYSRTDVNQAKLSVVLRVEPDDTIRAIEDRYEDFLESIELVGRSAVIADADPQLSVFGGPIRYREQLIEVIRDDAIQVASLIGPDASYTLSGLHNDVRWRLNDPLSLNLYIEYELSVQPN